MLAWPIVWILVSGSVGYLYGWLICPWTDGACLTSFIAGVWAVWFVTARNPQKNGRKDDLYYPTPREYKLPLKDVYSRINEIFAESRYNYGDRWVPVTSDTEAKRIVTDLRIKDKDTKKYVQAEVVFTDTSTDSTIVRFQFEANDDNWLEWRPCSEIIEELMRKIKLQIGEGMLPQELRKTENPDEQTRRKMPAPSWALIGLSALCIVLLLKDIVRELLR